MTEPFYYYLHTAAAEGGAATGAVFVPDGLWPTKYNFMFIDFIFGGIYNLVEDQNRECRTCSPPIPAFRNETFHSHTSMVDMFFGPYQSTQALYIVARSSGQNIRRIRYTGSTNRAPTAVASASKTNVRANEVVIFTGSESSDPDGDILTFLWNFGDGRSSSEKNASLMYSQLGEYKVTLTVTDSKGQTSQTFLDIVVGKPPTAVMESPPIGSEFIVGQVIRLNGSALDYQGKAIPASQIFWEVRQHHASHFHPFFDKQSGNNFDLYPAPEPEDFMAATNSFLEIIMYATDSSGVTTTISRNVQPKKVLIDIDSNPRGLSVLVDEFSVVTPSTITSWQNHKLRLNVKDQKGNIFSKWSIGPNRKTTFTVPAASSTNPSIIAFLTSSVATPRAAPVPVPRVAPVPVPRIPESPIPRATPVSAPQPVPNQTAPVASPNAQRIPLSSIVKVCSTGKPCKRCQGNCNNDDECDGNLMCYKKNAGLPGNVPGCIGIDLSQTDWCIVAL